MLGAEEFVLGNEGVGAGFVKDDDFACVEMVSFYDAEDCIVGVHPLKGQLLVFQELLFVLSLKQMYSLSAFL